MITEAEYLIGLVLLLVGFNVGFHEAGKGLTLTDLKDIFARLIQRVRGRTRD